MGLMLNFAIFNSIERWESNVLPCRILQSGCVKGELNHKEVPASCYYVISQTCFPACALLALDENH